jgi:hypothetical protein
VDDDSGSHGRVGWFVVGEGKERAGEADVELEVESMDRAGCFERLKKSQRRARMMLVLADCMKQRKSSRETRKGRRKWKRRDENGSLIELESSLSLSLLQKSPR